MSLSTLVSVVTVAKDPVKAARRLQDAGRCAGHVLYRRSAGEVFVREATVAVERTYSDAVEGAKRVLRGRF